ncbi:hypothetical protein DVH24_020776, partial [Malus domestica]
PKHFKLLYPHLKKLNQTSSKESSSKLTPKLIEYYCHNRILSALSDHLYDVYHATTSTAKELWETLEAEYGIVDVGMDRFTVSNFNDYKMVNNKSVGGNKYMSIKSY